MIYPLECEYSAKSAFVATFLYETMWRHILNVIRVHTDFIPLWIETLYKFISKNPSFCPLNNIFFQASNINSFLVFRANEILGQGSSLVSVFFRKIFFPFEGIQDIIRKLRAKFQKNSVVEILAIKDSVKCDGITLKVLHRFFSISSQLRDEVCPKTWRILTTYSFEDTPTWSLSSVQVLSSIWNIFSRWSFNIFVCLYQAALKWKIYFGNYSQVFEN